MKAAVLFLATLLALAACGENGKQAATQNSAAQPNDPYPEQEAQTAVETPAETREDVLAARQDAREAQIQTDAAARVVEADSRRQIQLEKCHALTGTARDECIDEANREFQRVKERVQRELDEDLGRQDDVQQR